MPEFCEPLRRLLTGRLLAPIDQGGSEEFTMFSLSRASVLSGSNAELLDDLLFEVPNGQCSHLSLHLLSMLRMTAYTPVWHCGEDA
jgi:hypothetical protein